MESKIWTKINNFDLWPPSISYIPIAAYAAYNALRTQSLFYFFLANPGIETGGMIMESKYNILKQIPKKYLPKGTLLTQPITKTKVVKNMSEISIDFPIILKPNFGERGRFVEKIDSLKELEFYLKKIKECTCNFIIQEYINMPLEVGIFYQRMPNEEKGTITSFIVKEMLHVIGDGSSSIEELMKKNMFTKIQLEDHRERFISVLTHIPKKNELFLVAPIASHNRGTVFIDNNNNITENLTNIIDSISKKVNGFYYGRYDIRVKNLQDLEKGNFKIIELNGAKGEPTHIYDRKHSLAKAYKDLFWHWKQMYEIAKQNHEKGIPYPTLKEGFNAYKERKKEIKT